MPDSERLNQVAQKLDLHIQRFDEFEVENRQRWADMLLAQESNTANIESLALSTKQLKESTEDVVEAWNSATGAVKVAGAIGRLFKWLSGFGILGVALVWVYDHMLKQ